MKYDKLRSSDVEGQILLTYTQAVRILFNKQHLWKIVKKKNPFWKKRVCFSKTKTDCLYFSRAILDL